MNVYVYIDGFNFYYNCYRGERNTGRGHLKWLDFRELAVRTLRNDMVMAVRYYTAMVNSDGSDTVRQQAYLEALRVHANVDVHLGQFRKTKRQARPVKPIGDMPSDITVEIMQEKGSDVALASHLMMDAFQNRFEAAVLITNDSDYAEPVRLLTTELNKTVGIISPDVNVSKRLGNVATFSRTLDQNLLGECQLPDTIHRDGRLPLTRPQAWQRVPDEFPHP